MGSLVRIRQAGLLLFLAYDALRKTHVLGEDECMPTHLDASMAAGTYRHCENPLDASFYREVPALRFSALPTDARSMPFACGTGELMMCGLQP